MAARWGLCLLLFIALIQIGFGYHGQQRIVGGSPTQGPIPYQVSLQGKNNSGLIDRLIQMMLMQSRSEWTHYCGGVIINECHVLTAAHCMFGADHTKISVLAGTTSRLRGGRRLMIESYVIHPDYAKLQSNDISMITLKESFTFSTRISAINFRDTLKIEGNIKVKLTGWGYTTPLAIFSLPVGLRTIEITTISNQECQDRGYNVTRTEICTNSGILRGACMGDSGGPLVSFDRTKLIGLVSYGSRICGSGRPEVYTRISEFVTWIEEQMKNKQVIPSEAEPSGPIVPEIPLNTAPPLEQMPTTAPSKPTKPPPMTPEIPLDNAPPKEEPTVSAPSKPMVVETPSEPTVPEIPLNTAPPLEQMPTTAPSKPTKQPPMAPEIPLDNAPSKEQPAASAPSNSIVVETVPKPPSMEAPIPVATTVEPTTIYIGPIVYESVTVKPSEEKPTTTSEWLISAFTPLGGVPAEILVPTTAMPVIEEAPVIPASPVMPEITPDMEMANVMEATPVLM